MRTPLRPCVAALSLAGIAALGLAGPAVAQETCGAVAPGTGAYPPAQADQQAAASDTTPEQGQRVTATSGCGAFAPGSEVQVSAAGVPVATVIASAGGEAVATFDLPGGVTTGAAEIAFSGIGLNGQPAEVSIPITIVGAAGGGAVAPDTEPGTVDVVGVSLPRTGSNEVLPLTAAGIGLIGAGAALVVVARRRRNEMLPVA